jgi:hypothetical protein
MANRNKLEAAGGLVLDCPAVGSWRVAWNEADWLGPLGLRAHCGGVRYAASSEPSGDRHFGKLVRSVRRR